MMFKTISRTAAVLAIVATSACAGSHEISTGVRTQATVNYADLDTARSPGANALLARIKGAAKKVCGPAPELRDLTGQRSYSACLNQSIDRAVADANNVLVSDIHRNGTSILSIAQRN